MDKNSLALGKVLENEYAKTVLPDLEKLARRGREINLEAAKPSWFDKLTQAFEGKGKAPGAAGGILGAFKKVQVLAEKVGITPAIDKEYEGLQNIKTSLRNYGYQMDEILNQAVPRLYAMKTAAADALAGKISTTAKSAKALGVAVANQADGVTASAQEAETKILGGSLSLAVMTQFKLRKDQLQRNYKVAEQRFKAVQEAWIAGENQIRASGALTPAQYAIGAAKIVGQTGYEFGRKALVAAERTGQAVEEFGTGAAAAIPFVKYLPYALLGLGALYAFSWLPKRRD